MDRTRSPKNPPAQICLACPGHPSATSQPSDPEPVDLETIWHREGALEYRWPQAMALVEQARHSRPGLWVREPPAQPCYRARSPGLAPPALRPLSQGRNENASASTHQDLSAWRCPSLGCG